MQKIYTDLKYCQSCVHSWGEKNQVIFEESKEEYVIIHGAEGEGEDFRISRDLDGFFTSNGKQRAHDTFERLGQKLLRSSGREGIIQKQR